MTTNRLDWTILHRTLWVATYIDGTTLVARTKAALMGKINLFDVNA